MTISIQANAAGTAGQINIGATPVVNIPVASGLPFCKNKLFNGEVTRINQRNFDGNWTPKGTWAGGNTIAQQELCYGFDMWAKASATDMLQAIEAGNYRPSTVHTISGTGVTTRQETSPASGSWNIIVPQTATNIQVEEGSVATPFEIRPITFELAQCQRYYQWLPFNVGFNCSGAGWLQQNTIPYSVPMRVTPSTANVTADPDTTQSTALNASNTVIRQTPRSALSSVSSSAAGYVAVTGFRSAASAVI